MNYIIDSLVKNNCIIVYLLIVVVIELSIFYIDCLFVGFIFILY